MQVRDILMADASFPNVSVACVNMELSCMVTGPVEELQTFAAHLMHGLGCKSLSSGPTRLPFFHHGSYFLLVHTGMEKE